MKTSIKPLTKKITQILEGATEETRPVIGLLFAVATELVDCQELEKRVFGIDKLDMNDHIRLAKFRHLFEELEDTATSSGTNFNELQDEAEDFVYALSKALDWFNPSMQPVPFEHFVNVLWKLDTLTVN